MAVAATTSASNSNLRCSKEEWPAWYDRRDKDLPRPILFFVAAKKNGPPADRRRKARAASILDFKPRLENRCMLFPVYTLFRASILDFKPKLGNRCKLFPVSALLRASILDFKPRLANRCMFCPEMSSCVQ